MIRFNKCLNKPINFWGLPVASLVLAAVFFFVGLIFWKALAGLFFAVVGVLLGMTISKMWHEGTIQIFLYWNFPKVVKKAPESWEKWFI